MTSRIHGRIGKSLRAAALCVPLAIGFVALSVGGCKEPPLGRTIEPTAKVDTGAVLTAIAGYRDWHKINANRFAIPVATALKCGPEKPVALPHADGKVRSDGKCYANVFLSDGGVIAHEKLETGTRTMTFPFGTTFVKERYSSPEQDVPDLLVVMIKRNFEYNSDHGNWEFAVVSGDGTKVLEYGRLANCGSCHAQAKAHDYVIGGYR